MCVCVCVCACTLVCSVCAVGLCLRVCGDGSVWLGHRVRVSMLVYCCRSGEHITGNDGFGGRINTHSQALGLGLALRVSVRWREAT